MLSCLAFTRVVPKMRAPKLPIARNFTYRAIEHVDPLTHIVIGRAVVAAADPGERPMRGVAWAAVLGALSPDIDSAIAFDGWDRYLRIHEIGTHTIVGAVCLASLTAAVVSWVATLRDRAASRRAASGVTRRPPVAAYGVLWTAAAAGVLSHLILDVICGGRLRLGWPVVSGRVTIPLVAMADPWFIGISVAGLLAQWVGGMRRQPASRAIIAAAVVLLAAKGALLARALRSSPIPVSLAAVEAQWGSLTDWSIFTRTPSEVRAWKISGGGAPPAPSISHHACAGTPLARASLALDTVGNFRSVHAFAFPVERPLDDGRSELLWSDLRYCWPTAKDDAAIVRAGESVSCGVWAGGLFDARGQLITQLVQIGGVVQRRALR
jgi:membrane-bound metal-dependent hydrolase YbcI (DUF457 family)